MKTVKSEVKATLNQEGLQGHAAAHVTFSQDGKRYVAVFNMNGIEIAPFEGGKAVSIDLTDVISKSVKLLSAKALRKVG